MEHRGGLVSSKPIKICGSLTFFSFLLAVILLNHNMLASYRTQSELKPTGTECVYSISAHVLSCSLNATHQSGPITVGPENVTSGTGVCRDNPECIGRKFKRVGPIEPGKYRINHDTRAGGAERFRLEPVPPVPGWRVWLPGWMPGALRGGFMLGLGDLVTHGCIMVLRQDSKVSAQYKKVQELLAPQSTARNELLVVR
jgi:hypothetical protein